jgi:CRP-like cAMP-binding protein
MKQGDSTKPNILVVEDNYLMSESLCDLVRTCGFDVAGAVAAVDSGIRFLDQRRVDGAIVDINLAGKPSFPLCVALAQRHIPFVFMTGYQRFEIPRAFRDRPLLNKPVEPGKLRAALSAFSPPLAQETQLGRGNVLLDGLGDDLWHAFQPMMERVSIELLQFLEIPGRAVEHVYFPVSSLVSVLNTSPKGQQIEIGLVGSEGLVGIAAILGSTVSIFETVVRAPGETWRIGAKEFQTFVSSHRDFQGRLLGYVHAFLGQMAATAIASGHTTIEARLARWLVMASDRLHSDEIVVTHGELSRTLAVRRSGITMAFHALEAKGLIKSRRGFVRILDRDGLIEATAGVYGIAEALYERFVEERAVPR